MHAEKCLTELYDWNISSSKLIKKLLLVLKDPLFPMKFLKSGKLPLLNGTSVSAKKMLKDLIFYLRKYHHVLDFRNDYDLISAFKHRWLQFSTLDRIKDLRNSGIPIAICGQVFQELIYGSGASTIGSLTPYFLECHLAGKYSYQQKGHEFCSFESCPGEPVIPILVLEKVIEVDLFINASHTYMGDVPCLHNLLRGYNIPLHVIDFPSGSHVKPWAFKYLVEQLKIAVKTMEQFFEKRITEEDIHRGIKMINAVRKSYIEYDNIILSTSAPPISSFENSLVQSCIVDMQGDPIALVQAMKELNAELKRRVKNKVKAPGVKENPIRIYAAEKTGYDLTTLNLINDLGAVLIGPEVCETMYLSGLVDENKNPYEAIAEYYMYKYPWSPTVSIQKRADWFLERVKQVKAHGVIFTGVWGCQWDPAYRKYLADRVEKELGIPSLFLEFEDIPYEFQENGRYKIKEQVRTRIEAFIELIKHRLKTN